MNIVDIANRMITVKLSPEEALVLSHACQNAVFNDCAGEDATTRLLVETCGAFFGAAALAAGMRSRISEHQASACTYRGMLNGQLLDPIFPVSVESED